MSESPATPRSTTQPAASLLPSWPQPPRPVYALAPIPAYSPRNSSLRSATSASSRSPNHERTSPYPSSRPSRAEMLELHSSQDASTSHEAEMYRTRQALRAQLFPGGRPATSSGQSPSQPRSVSSSSHSRTSTSSSNAQPSSSKDAQHKVYLLNCKHCGNFLSDRGMKAVLLLKPNITLYSTDIVPSTCGPFFANSHFHGGVDSNEPPVERTCECLTQSLGCYGCGAQVGYNIISPCARCTSSVMKHSRSSNGHRTVLHCSEIAVRERRYIPGEPGVRAQPIPPAPQTLTNPAHTHADGLVDVQLSQSPQNLFRHSNESRRDVSNFRDTLPPSLTEEDLEADKVEMAYFYQPGMWSSEELRRIHDRMVANGTYAPASAASSSAAPKGARVLRRGDTLYWTDLIAGGERAQPFDPDPILERPTVGR